jgi:hypothetical protein
LSKQINSCCKVLSQVTFKTKRFFSAFYESYSSVTDLQITNSQSLSNLMSYLCIFVPTNWALLFWPLLIMLLKNFSSFSGIEQICVKVDQQDQTGKSLPTKIRSFRPKAISKFVFAWVVFAGLKPDYQAWNDKVQIFGVKEEIPWCRQYAIFTDKFDERLKNAQIGIQYTYCTLSSC